MNRLRPLLFVLAASLVGKWQLRADDMVCQVLTSPGDSLQHALGITCNVTNNSDGSAKACKCEWPLIDNSTWVPVFLTNRSYDVEPGKWIPISPDGRCVALTRQRGLRPPEPEVMSCPPGFYCAGGSHPPRSCSYGDHCPGNTVPEGRRCPTNYICPFPSGPVYPCPKGALCPEGTSRPNACSAGYYCRGGVSRPCPSGFWCAFGTNDPIECGFLSLCPEGSLAERKSAAILGVAAMAGGFSIGSRYYHVLVQRGLRLFGICLGLVLLMWMVDLAIAGWLTLNLFLVSLNWALLRWNNYPPLLPKAMMCGSLFAMEWILWLVNPPWALLVGGLLACSCLGWLMSRQGTAFVWLGRLLLFLAFCALCTAYWMVDPAFTLVGACFMLATVMALAVSWACEQRRQHKLRHEFITRWPFREGNAASPRGSHSASFSGSPESFSGSSPSLDQPAGSASLQLSSRSSEVVGQASAQTQATRATGVSFHLREVDFFLLDGKRLLKSVSLRIEAGKQVAIMGPSGGGKSTLLAVLSGRASYGRVTGQLLVGGRMADDLRFLKDVTGFVPQDDILHGELTVEENIRYQAALRMPASTTPEEVSQQSEEVMRDLNLSLVSQVRVGTPEKRGVSGGQRKRVSIAMELVARPLLLFADEPTSGLDSTTSHEVIGSMTSVARAINSTTVAVIHQPRYETLTLFDDLVLLGCGGCLVYAGPTTGAVQHFQERLGVTIPQNTNPADKLLDAIQPDPEAFANVWREHTQTLLAMAIEEQPAPDSLFYRQRPAFFHGMLIFMDRSMLQCFRAQHAILVNQALCITAVWILCRTLSYTRFDQFMMQGAFASLFLMLLQGVAAQRVFGADILITLREARVGGSMVAYLVAKDLAALLEVTVSAAVFTAVYGFTSGAHLPLAKIFAGSWAFVYSVFGMSYIYSITLSAGAAQMCAVVSAFVAFCVAGVYRPLLPDLVEMLGGRGWMIPAVSPVRWLHGYLVTAEAPYLTDLSKQVFDDKLKYAGYDLKYLDMCQSNLLGRKDSDLTLQQDWLEGRCWVCSTAPMLLLGLIFRFLAGICLVLHVNAQTSGLTRFLAQSSAGAWKLAGRLFTLLVGAFLALFLFAEIWTFGLLRVELPQSGPPVPRHNWGSEQLSLAWPSG